MDPFCAFENKDFYRVIPWSWIYKDHLIEVHYTILGQHRVTIREVDSHDFTANWCAGSMREDVELLLGLAVRCIDEELNYPFNSRVKPYWQDHNFMKFLETHNPEPWPLYELS